MHSRGEHANSTKKGPRRDLNRRPSSCEVMVLTATVKPIIFITITVIIIIIVIVIFGIEGRLNHISTTRATCVLFPLNAAVKTSH